MVLLMFLGVLRYASMVKSLAPKHRIQQHWFLRQETSHKYMQFSTSEMTSWRDPPMYIRQVAGTIWEMIEGKDWESLKQIQGKHNHLSNPRILNKILLKFQVHDVESAQQFFSWSEKQVGFPHSQRSYAIMLALFAKAGMFSHARCLMDRFFNIHEMPSMSKPMRFVLELYEKGRTLPVVFDLLIEGFVRHGQIKHAADAFALLNSEKIAPMPRTCNSLLKALEKEYRYESASWVFEKMLELKIAPNLQTFKIMISFSCREGNLKDAMRMLYEMENWSLKPDVPIFNNVIVGLCKTGRADEAVSLNATMKMMGMETDVDTYNCLVESFCKEGKVDKALNMIRMTMKVMGLKPNLDTYKPVVWALCKAGQSAEAMGILQEVLKEGLTPDVSFYRELVVGYVTESEVKDEDSLRKVLMRRRDYYALVQDLCEAGKPEDAVKHLEHMKVSGLKLDSMSSSRIIESFCNKGMPKEALEFLHEMLRQDSPPKTPAFGIVISGLCQSGFLQTAMGFLKEMIGMGMVPEDSVYKPLIARHCEEGGFYQSLMLIYDMIKRGVVPRQAAYAPLILFSCERGEVSKGRILLNEMHERCRETPVYICYVKLVHGHCLVGKMDGAADVFRDMHIKGYIPPSFLYTLMIDGHCNQGQVDEAIMLLKRMIYFGACPNIFTYRALISGCSLQGRVDDALKLYKGMERNGLKPDRYIYHWLIDGLCKLDRINEADGVLGNMLDADLVPFSCTYLRMIEQYCKHRSIDETVKLHYELQRRGVALKASSYNSFIKIMCQVGELGWASYLLREMAEIGLKPNKNTFITLIYAYGKRGLFHDADCCQLYECLVTSGLSQIANNELNHHLGKDDYYLEEKNSI